MLCPPAADDTVLKYFSPSEWQTLLIEKKMFRNFFLTKPLLSSFLNHQITSLVEKVKLPLLKKSSG